MEDVVVVSEIDKDQDQRRGRHDLQNTDAAGADLAVLRDCGNLHVLATDGCFYNDAAFMVCPLPDTGELEKLFRYEVFKMLIAEGKINKNQHR